MRRKNKRRLIILLILLCISFILFFYELVFKDDSAKTYQISVIAPGKSDESLMMLKEGTEQAASELNANIRFIFLSQEQDSQEQIELLKRESKNNVDAILILPIDCEEVTEAIEEARKKVPIIIIQSSLKINSSIDKITNDEYLLGQQLTKEALDHIGENKKIAIINSSLQSTAIEERYEGCINALEGKSIEYSRYTLRNYDKGRNYTEIEEMIKREDIGVIICLDIKSSEYIGELRKTLRERFLDELRVYGVGNTNKIISLLEEAMINGTATQNEFNIGYLAVQNAINNKNKKTKEIKLKATVVTNENMYLDENERILFQFVR